jgi:ribosomal protein S18 acetylase RimI-like enzyme
MSVTRRPIGEQDMDFLLHLYASTREEELSVVDWTPEQKMAFLRQQFEAQHRHYQEHYAGAAFDLLLVDGRPAGRLYVARWTKTLRIVDIALMPEFRGRGIGTALVTELFAEADASGRSVSIHVESNNPARRLYERLGFQDVGEHGVYKLMERPGDQRSEIGGRGAGFSDLRSPASSLT